MTEKMSHIPEQVYIEWLGRTIDIHWNYHAILMFSIWMVLVPLCILIIRFGKPRPTEYGLRTQIGITNLKWWWFTSHKYGLITAVIASLAGAGLALVVSGGFSATVHAMFGALTIIMGCLQVISAFLRGTHGGKYYYTGDPDDPSTWAGDHYSRTKRRRMFEAYHKTSGYFTFMFAVGAVGSGLMQYPMPVLTWLMFLIPLAFLGAWVTLEFMGRAYDGYRAVHGYGMEHPFNKEREFL